MSPEGTPKPLRFHWGMSKVDDNNRGDRVQTELTALFDPPTHLNFAHEAERAGIDSLLLAFGVHRPDPFSWSAALGSVTERMKYMVAVRSGVMSPTYFVQQVNTISVLTGGRLTINVVAGRLPEELAFYGDFLSHDERYARSDDFWTICHRLWAGDEPVSFNSQYYRVEGARVNVSFHPDEFWRQRLPHLRRPEIYMGGNSTEAMKFAIRHADCLLTFADAPRKLAERIRPVLDAGKEVALYLSMIAGPTRDEAVAAGQALVERIGESGRQVNRERRSRLDSVGFEATYALADSGQDWLTPHLWTGLVPYVGPPAMALVGTPDDIVDAIFEFRDAGVSQFLLGGRTDEVEQIRIFGQEVLPRIRERERREAAAATA